MKRPRITEKTIEKLEILSKGGRINKSGISAEWLRLLEELELIQKEYNGRKTRIYSNQGERLWTSLGTVDERYANPETMRKATEKEATRESQAYLTGNSKLRRKKTSPGFLLKSLNNTTGLIKGEIIGLKPQEGTYIWVWDWRNLKIPKDMTIIGVENMENFERAEEQRGLFEKHVKKDYILVSRYPQTKDIREWIKSTGAEYLHYGDFDLAGIAIYQNEYKRHLGEKARMLIPEDIEERIRNGTRERYESQYKKYKGVKSEEKQVRELIELIHRYKRCYDQEGYIINN